MSVVHILNQYIWPDAAPTGVYAEQLAVALQGRGSTVRLVGGIAAYRQSERPEPSVPKIIIPHWQGSRGNHLATLREYFSVHHGFAHYIKEQVQCGDVVIVSSAPPTTLSLAKNIRRVGARSIYWLQDYYPELIRGVWDYPRVLRSSFRKWWDGHLSNWDCVVKAANNIRGTGENIRVIRNWPTLNFANSTTPMEPGTALYAGNLGYGHHLPSFVHACRKLLDEGYTVNIHADGPGVTKLPGWLKSQGAFGSEQQLSMALQKAETHLIAGHPDIQEAIFPSKIWNSLALKRSIIATGFAGVMQKEFEFVKQNSFDKNLQDWCELIIEKVSLHNP